MADENPTTQPTTTTSNNGDWRSGLTDDLKAIPAVKEATDLNAYVKRSAEWQSQVGKVQNDFKTFKDSVEAAGKLRPESADKYVITRPDSVPEHAWSDKTVQSFRDLAFKHGLSQQAISELIQFDAQRFGELEPLFAKDKDAAKKAISDQWQAEGRTFDEMMGLALEGVKQRFTQQEWDVLEHTGLADHPVVLSALAKIGEMYSEGYGLTGGGVADKSAEDEANAIVRDKNHPKHADFWRGDKAVNEYVQSLYKKAYPGTYGG